MFSPEDRSMLPYETEKHARQIFKRLVLARLDATGNTPEKADAIRLVQMAVRMASEFAAAFQIPTPTTDNNALRPITFEALVLEWQKHSLKRWQKRDCRTALSRLRRYLFPTLASQQVSEVSTPELIAALRAVEDAGHLPLAHRLRKDLVHIYRFAIASGYARHNPATEVRHVLFKWKP